MTPRALAAILAAAFMVELGAASPAAAQQPEPPKTAPKLTRPPRLARFVEAPYPEVERAAGRAASVVLQIAISKEGTVTAVLVAESAGAAFDAAAVEAAKQFVFEPAEVDDKPAAIRIVYRYEFVLKVEAPTTAVFDGVVRHRKTKKPLAGVEVELDSSEKATSGVDGRFHFERVSPGKHAVTLSGADLTPVRTEESFDAGKRVDATYDVEPRGAAAPGETQDDLEIVIVAPQLKKEVVSTEIAADQARRVPGTQGDVLKVIEALPGVGRATVGSGALVVWGAAPQDTRVYIDGVHVPRLYHSGGLRSVVSSELVRSVDLAPGGYGSAYGRGLGGLVTVQLKPLEDDGFHGAVAVDVLDAAAMTKASITSRLRVAVAARYSYLDRLIPVVTDRDVGELFPVPRYHDGQLRVVYQLSVKSSVEAGALLSSDKVDRSVASSDPGSRKEESRDLRWVRGYVRYRAQLDDGAAVTLTPWIGVDSSSQVFRFGGTPTELGVDSTVYGLRAAWTGRPLPAVTVTVGLDGEAADSALQQAGSVTSPAREGDVRVFGQAPSDQINADSWSTTIASVAAYAEADVALAGGRLHVLPGVRFEPYVVSASRRTPVEGNTPSIGLFSEETAVEPRLAVQAELSRRVRLKAAYGLYHQSPQAEDLSAVFGNPLLGSSYAHHGLVSATHRITETLSVESTGFYAATGDLAARSPSSSPLLAEALVQTGAGRAYGAQLLLRQDLTHGFFGWVSYAVVRSERQDRPGEPYRLFDFDQTHVLTALASYEIGAGFELGARFRFATGLPRTPVVSAYYDARSDSFQPVFGARNGERIPEFAELDLRAAKRFRIGKAELEAYLDVQNVTNRENPEEIVYTHDYARKDYITGLPILPVLGLRCSW